MRTRTAVPCPPSSKKANRPRDSMEILLAMPGPQLCPALAFRHMGVEFNNNLPDRHARASHKHRLATPPKPACKAKPDRCVSSGDGQFAPRVCSHLGRFEHLVWNHTSPGIDYCGQMFVCIFELGMLFAYHFPQGNLTGLPSAVGSQLIECSGCGLKILTCHAT